ncbi:MAG: hypothetical protein ABW039_08620 [Sphingobium sp.]
MADYKFVVLTNAVEGQDDAFNQWYDETHLGEVVALPGFSGATRFRIHPTGDAALAHRYLAIYDMQTDDPAGTLANLNQAARSGGLRMSGTMAPDVVTMLVEQIAQTAG